MALKRDGGPIDSDVAVVNAKLPGRDAAPPPLPPGSCRLVVETEAPKLKVTLRQHGRVVAEYTRDSEPLLPPGDYAVALSGSKPGLRASRDPVTISPEDREFRLNVWQAKYAWPAEALRAGAIPAPKLPRAALFDESFRDPKHKRDFPQPPAPAKGLPQKAPPPEYGYGPDRYFIEAKGPKTPSGKVWPVKDQAALDLAKTARDFAYQVSGRSTRDPGLAWGVTATDMEEGKRFDLTVVLNGKGELSVWPGAKQAPGFRVEWLRHSAIKAGEEFNTLLAVLRGPQLELYVNAVAVCDPITLPRPMKVSVLTLVARSGARAGRVEFQRAALWSAKDIPPPTARGAVAAR